MQIFFRDEMVAASADASIPSQEKIERLLSRIGRDHWIVGDFAPVEWNVWSMVHDASYVQRVAAADEETMEAASIPPSAAMLTSIRYHAASMLAATSAAFVHGCAFSPTAGFHHAHWAKPGPFCLLNALPLAALQGLSAPGINRVLILDCDYHAGDGTEDILAHLQDERILHRSLGFTFKRSNQAADYLEEIDNIAAMIRASEFDLVIYQAGMDTLLGDPAGGGILTLEQTQQRDSKVFSTCAESSVPIVWNLAGGYQRPEALGWDRVIAGHHAIFTCAVSSFR